MPAVDAHLHVFATEDEGLLAQGGERLAGHAGTFDEVHAILDRGRITRVAAFSTLPIALWRNVLGPRWPSDEIDDRLLARAMSQNDWLCAATADDDRLIAVVGADATLDAAKQIAHLEAKLGEGARAIKIHPALNATHPEHPGFEPVWKLATESTVPVVTHGGEDADMYASSEQLCAPANFVPVLDRHPGLRLVIAHLAYPQVDTLVEMTKRYPNLYTDLSGTLGRRVVPPDDLARAVRAVGPDRALFGSDFPYFDPEVSLDVLGEARLSDAELAAVTEGTACELFALS